MNHNMHLDIKPFQMIERGIKTIEYRLNDEKRQKINIGDTITFYKKTLEKETIKVIITNLIYYKDLLSMFTANFNKELKYIYDSPKAVVDDTPYYTNDEIKKYGCVAICFRKI